MARSANLENVMQTAMDYLGKDNGLLVRPLSKLSHELIMEEYNKHLHSFCYFLYEEIGHVLHHKPVAKLIVHCSQRTQMGPPFQLTMMADNTELRISHNFLDSLVHVEGIYLFPGIELEEYDQYDWSAIQYFVWQDPPISEQEFQSAINYFEQQKYGTNYVIHAPHSNIEWKGKI